MNHLTFKSIHLKCINASRFTNFRYFATAAQRTAWIQSETSSVIPHINIVLCGITEIVLLANLLDSVTCISNFYLPNFLESSHGVCCCYFLQDVINKKNKILFTFSM